MLRTLTLIMMYLGLLAIPAHGEGRIVPTGPNGYSWISSAPGEFALLLDQRQIGAWRAGQYYAFLATGDWSPALCPCEAPEALNAPRLANECPCGCGCPSPCPCMQGKGHCGSPKCRCSLTEGRHEPNYGIEKDKINPGEHKINGRSVSKKEIISALSDVPKDQNKLRLTLISPEPSGQMAHSLRTYAQQNDLLFQSYTPDDWAIQGAGFYTGKTPTVYLQTPSGKVLLRLDAYSGQTEGPLAQAVRSADPGYDKDKDPDGTDPFHKLVSSLIQKLKALPGEVWAGVLAVLYFLTRKESK